MIVYQYKVYLISLALILLWWGFAFQPTDENITPLEQKTENLQTNAPLLEILSPLNRETLREALAGDFELMTKLIADWDIDARLLESRGVHLAKRLDRRQYIKAQLIGRQLKKSFEPSFHKHIVFDDLGKGLDLQKPLTRFLPQTYVAATFLLTLAPTNQIVAIPKGLREQTHFFPKNLTDQIPLDIDRFNGEKLFREKPDVAFVANYSHPQTLNALQSQGVPLFTFKHFETIPEIQAGLARTGEIINRPLEADLLNLFIEASLLAIDNRVLAFNEHLNEQGIRNPRILYLNYRSQYSQPTSRTFTGQLLDRMGINMLTCRSTQSLEWFIPIYQEQIRMLNPDYLIVASAYPEHMPSYLHDDAVMRELNAVKMKRTSYIDDSVQQSPTQYVILAYYDLFQAITKAHYP